MKGRAAGLAAALWLLASCRGTDLPAEITIEHVVLSLAPPLGPGATVDGPAAADVRRAEVQPGDRPTGGGPRDALITPPGAVVHFRLDVPANAELALSFAVKSDRKRHSDRSGIEFAVRIDGQSVFAQEVNPAATRKDRTWHEGRVVLAPWTGRTVVVDVEARTLDASQQAAGLPAWSRIQVVEHTTRARQLASNGPNIVILLVDTLRADAIGVYGATPSPTPTLDHFAAGGTVFTEAVAQSSWTMPAVASIFTGLHPRSHGAVGPDKTGTTHDGGGTMLPDTLTTIAELAQSAGVTTFGVSANMIISRDTNFSQGFETFIELPLTAKTHDYAAGEVVSQTFLDWLPRARSLRFFAYLHYMEPHGPYAPPPDLKPTPPPGIRAMLAAGNVLDFARDFNAGRVAAPSPTERDYLHQLYTADVRHWDNALAALLRALTDQGVLEHTVVFVVADHGEEFLEHGQLTHGAQLYEETVRIPMVVVGPSVPVARRDDAAQGIDVLPTVAGLLGVSAPAALPGRNLFATSDAADVVSEIVSGFGDSGAGRGMVSLRRDRVKLIQPPQPAAAQLYDLSTDPGEHADLGPNAPAAGDLAARLDHWAAAVPPPPRGGTASNLHDRLHQLGYVD